MQQMFSKIYIKEDSDLREESRRSGGNSLRCRYQQRNQKENVEIIYSEDRALRKHFLTHSRRFCGYVL